MDAKVQLQEVKDRLAQLDPNNRDNLVQIATLRQQEIQLQQQIMAEEDSVKSAQIQQQVAAVDAADIEIPRQYDFAADYNDIFGTTLLNNEIQRLLDAQREQLHSYYIAIQEERDNTIRILRNEVDEANAENKRMIEVKGQAELERDDFKKRFENAGELIKELQTEVERLKEHEIELIETANKAPLLYPHKVIDITPSNLDAGEAIREERAKELAAKPKVWGLQWADELKKTEYKAVGEDGTELIIKRLEVGKYNVQEGPRHEQVVTEVVAEDVQDSVAPEVPFPELPRAEAPEVPDIPAISPVVEGQQSVEVSGITETQLEERLVKFAQEFGLVKQAVA
jgi:hypothetical protein